MLPWKTLQARAVCLSDFWLTVAGHDGGGYKDPAAPPHILVSHHQVRRQHRVMKGSATVRGAEDD